MDKKTEQPQEIDPNSAQSSNIWTLGQRRVLLKPLRKKDEKVKSGLILPTDENKVEDKTVLCEIIAFGKETNLVLPGVKIGDVALKTQGTGHFVRFKGEQYWNVVALDILQFADKKAYKSEMKDILIEDVKPESKNN